MTDIIGIGTILMDHVVQLDRLPDRDSKRAVHDHWFQVGGPVPTALAFAAGLGHTCRFSGAWGDDQHGDMIERDLAGLCIDARSGRRHVKGRTGFAHIWIDGEGTRTTAYSRGDLPPLRPSDLANLPRSGVLLHLDGSDAGVVTSYAREIREHGGFVMLDGGSYKPDMDRLLPHIDLLIASRTCMTDLTGSLEPSKAGPALMELGPTEVVMTDGERGAWLYRAGHHPHHQPAIQVDVVDTNGAGDLFCGGILHGILTGWKMPQILRYAAAAAAAKCRIRGNRVPPDDPLLLMHSS